MSSLTVTVKSRLVGSGTFGPPISPVTLEIAADERLTVTELIERVVHEQIKVMDSQTDLDPEQVRGTFERQYGRLPGDAPAKQEGKSEAAEASPGTGGARYLDPATEVGNARRAFETGRLAIVADGKHVEGATTVLELKDGSKVTFMRLIQVAGG